MGKPRRTQRQKGRTSVQGEDVDDDTGIQEAMPSSKETSSKFFNDAVDDFHEEKFKDLMARGVEFESEEENLESEDEVLALDVPDEEEDDEEENDEEEEKQNSMESDLEERVDDGLPNELAWGQKKRLYYDTEYDVSKKKSKSQEEVDAEAQEEEEEAQNIQKRLLGNLSEEDYGLDFIQAFTEQQREEKQTTQKIVKDLKKMSEKEKLKLLKKESPELLELIRDLRVKLTELKDQLEPLIKRVKEGDIPPGKGSNYLQIKYQLYLNYCTNISYYLALKAKRIPVHGHPIIERLVTYRNLINDLQIVDQRLSSELRLLLLEGSNENESRRKKCLAVSKSPISQLRNNSETLQKRLSSAVMDMEPAEDSDVDEKDALKYYHQMEEMLKQKRKKRVEPSMEEEPAIEENDLSAKRAITYQIAKNKGLTPKRKKIDRNPRVKHREKFRRAKIRRKGQVREVRKEESRYAGELSGIRAGLKKSIKLK